MKKLWFKRKRYGWGWYPSTWQGWAITFGYVAIVLGLAVTLDETAPLREVLFTYFIPIFVLTALFIWIAYKTGESPRWQWGERDEDPT